MKLLGAMPGLRKRWLGMERLGKRANGSETDIGSPIDVSECQGNSKMGKDLTVIIEDHGFLESGLDARNSVYGQMGCQK